MSDAEVQGFCAEHEISYCVNNCDLNDLLLLMFPMGGNLDLDGHLASVKAVGIKKTLHLFGPRTEGLYKDRLKIWRKGNNLHGTRDLKDYDGNLKRENKIAKFVNAAAGAAIARSMDYFVSGFVKNRLGLRVKWNGTKLTERTVRIGIDHIVPVNLADPMVPGIGFYHIDFESDGDGSETLFTQSAMFRKKFMPFLTPLGDDDTKWVRSRSVYSHCLTTSAWTTNAFLEFCSNALLLSDGSRAGHPLNDPY